MDATASKKQGPQPASDDGASMTSSFAPELGRAPSSELAAVAGGSGAAEECGGVGDEDEQVERFYALLANIRAMRNVYGTAGGSSRKRPRVAEDPPWRPKFRMEDFLEVDDAVSAKKGRKDDLGKRERPDDDDAADGEVVQENDRVSVSQSTRVCTDSA